jgi:CheY-like chemotaxis protein
MRVLYVDDDRVNTLLLRQLCLGVAGVELQAAETGAEALELVADWRPQLLVIDLHLPDTDGYALLPRLRAALAEPALPAVLCTAEHPLDVADAAHAAGFQHTWTKPVALDEVRAAIASFAAAAPTTP